MIIVENGEVAELNSETVINFLKQRQLIAEEMAIKIPQCEYQYLKKAECYKIAILALGMTKTIILGECKYGMS